MTPVESLDAARLGNAKRRRRPGRSREGRVRMENSSARTTLEFYAACGELPIRRFDSAPSPGQGRHGAIHDEAAAVRAGLRPGAVDLDQTAAQVGVGVTALDEKPDELAHKNGLTTRRERNAWILGCEYEKAWTLIAHRAVHALTSIVPISGRVLINDVPGRLRRRPFEVPTFRDQAVAEGDHGWIAVGPVPTEPIGGRCYPAWDRKVCSVVAGHKGCSQWNPGREHNLQAHVFGSDVPSVQRVVIFGVVLPVDWTMAARRVGAGAVDKRFTGV